MRLKSIRYWLAGKILGGMVIEELGDRLIHEKKKWQKEQLSFGNPVTIQFEVVETGNKYERTVK